MKRLKFKHSYHDALIRTIRYHENSDIVLEIDLCSCCNPPSSSATLSFLNLRNFAEARELLESVRQANAARGYIDEIVAIVRDDERGCLLDLATAGAVRLDARGLHEA